MEKKNSFILAPSTVQVTKMYNLWKEDHTGTLMDFYKFITEPTVQRARFLSGLECQSEFNGIFIVNRFEL